MNNLFMGGAIFGVVTACWNYIKIVIWKIINLFIQNVELREEILTQTLISHLLKYYKKSNVYEKVYLCTTDKLIKENTYISIPYEFYGKKSLIFWNGFVPFIWMGENSSKKNSPEGGILPKNEDSSAEIEIKGNILYIRGTLNIDKIIEEACKKGNNKDKNRRFFIKHVPFNTEIASSESGAWHSGDRFRLIGYNKEELIPLQDTKLLDNLILPLTLLKYIDEIKLWLKSKDWYKEKGIPWRRGWLLYGLPGSGKTSIIRAIGEDLDLPIFIYNLAEIDNREFITRWNAMKKNAPCIALIEDIDNVFHGRKNVTNRVIVENKKGESKGKLDFDILLNCIDGIERSEGIFTIITTNDISKIDQALGVPSNGTISTRPGRLDRAIELGFMGKSEKKIMARKILKEYSQDLEDMLQYIETDVNETPAQFQEKCCSIALSRYWVEIPTEFH